jgi:hypothetical protein
LRKFQHFRRQLRCFVVRAVQRVKLELDRGEAVSQFGALAGERLLVDVFGQAQVEQPILLLHKQRILPLKLVALSERLGLGVS